MNHEEHYRKLERMYGSARCNEYYAARLRVSSRTAEVEIAVQEKFFQAAGVTHGSVYFKALDDAAFFAVSSVVKDVLVLTVSFHVYFIRPVSQGTIRATGRVVSASPSLFFAEASLADSRGKEIGRGSGMFAKSVVALADEIGYK